MSKSNLSEKLSRLADILAEKSISFCLDHPVAPLSSFKIGGVAAIAVFPADRGQFVDALRAVDALGVRSIVLGNASNMLFAFERFEGVMIFTGHLSQVSVSDGRIDCDAGVSLTYLSNLAAKHSLRGLEFAYGIPGLVGGAIYMNAGAYGGQMSDVVDYTVAYDRAAGEVYRIYDGGFGYRESRYSKNGSLVCLGASLMLPRGDAAEIRARMEQNAASRRDKQPLELPSAGSYFKRPQGDFAGRLIEECGLKGLSVGGAAVSPKHAGFIVNLGGASYSDVLALEARVIEAVEEKFGVRLEREVRVISQEG